MRQYLLDEIRRPDISRIRDYLHEHAQPSGLEGIWWVELADDLLSDTQQSHPQCRPFIFGIELGKDFLKFEFLIRSRQTMRCPCIGYATRGQRDFILAFADRLVQDLSLST